MVRKGWSVMELPADGWVKVLRGRRPPSEQWPMASKNAMKVETEKRNRGRWRQRPQVGHDKVKSLEAALGALGPEDNCAKEQIQEVLRRAKEGRQAVRVNPDIVKAEAVAKVERLQKALDASGGLGPKVDAIKRALKKAQEVARERPIAELIKECKEFIDRSTKHISKSKTDLETETGLLEDSRARLTRLEAQAPPVGDPVVAEGAQVLTLQQMVNQLKGERDSLSQELRRSRAVKARAWCGEGPPDVSVIPPIPDHLQDLEEWMNGRNCELRDALEFGSPEVVGCVSTLLAQGASRMASMRKGAAAQELVAMDLQNGPGTRMFALIDAADAKRRCLDGGVPGCFLRVRCRRCQAKYGLRGVRVGEAGHPGPVDTQLDTLEERATPASTVLASPYALRRVVPMGEPLDSSLSGHDG